MKITSRKLESRIGQEGPAHDPYGWAEMIVHLNGDTVVARVGLACWLEVRDSKTRRPLVRLRFSEHDLGTMEAMFEKLTGIAPREFYRYYERIHRNDIDDPFGPPSRYI